MDIEPYPRLVLVDIKEGKVHFFLSWLLCVFFIASLYICICPSCSIFFFSISSSLSLSLSPSLLLFLLSLSLCLCFSFPSILHLSRLSISISFLPIFLFYLQYAYFCNIYIWLSKNTIDISSQIFFWQVKVNFWSLYRHGWTYNTIDMIFWHSGFPRTPKVKWRNTLVYRHSFWNNRMIQENWTYHSCILRQQFIFSSLPFILDIFISISPLSVFIY